VGGRKLVDFVALIFEPCAEKDEGGDAGGLEWGRRGAASTKGLRECVCVCVCVFNGGEATAEKLLSDFKNLLSHATHYKQVENLKKGEVNVKK
jgi:hypothetical protein